MRSRSNRLFVILLHLVGCPQHFHNTFEGIVGVQPWPIVMETTTEPIPEPVWLQDMETQTCLGPDGRFTEHCGDATLWLAVRQRLRKRKRARMGLWGVDEEELDREEARIPSEGIVFYLVDRDVDEILETVRVHNKLWWNPTTWFPPRPQRRRGKRQHSGSTRQSPLECLMYNDEGHMEVGTCDTMQHHISPEAALPGWGWRIQESDSSLRPSKRNDKDFCAVVIEDTNKVALSECTSGAKSDHPERPVNLSLVRYHAAPATDVAKQSSKNQERIQAAEGNTDDARAPLDAGGSDSRSSSLPSVRDLAHKAVLGAGTHHPQISTPRLLFEKRGSSMLLRGDSKVGASPLNEKQSSTLVHPESSKVGVSGSSMADLKKNTGLHNRNRRIPVHPYIAASKNEIWTDPQTGLEYPTDLSGYLGHDRKERGRQTLMGVGQYRKGYVIKVYGIAYYVSKRDVLADPFFEPYAEMSAEELQKHPEFYEHLRLHPENFERSIFIKTNMQLSAETIRGSLKADWSMLSEEAKDLIMESSMKAQPADERTLEIIKDPNNPSRCSCVSTAPEQYNADPTCCARGTELVFTWLKNGDIECRLNGRIAFVFPRPDIAQGILFEYLRTDDPISPELRDHAVDGFPFLLAPLTQVKGVSIAAGAQDTKSNKQEGENPIARVFAEFAENVGSHAAGMASATQRAVDEAAANIQQAARSFGDSARALGDAARAASDDFGKEMTRKREAFMQRAAALPDILTRLKKDPVSTARELLSKSRAPPFAQDEEEAFAKNLKAPSGRLFGYPLKHWFGDVYYAPDEIGPMVTHPTMDMTRKVFLFLVHLYLLLLFIVSFPGSYTTIIIRSKSRKLRRLSTESDTSAREPSQQYEKKRRCFPTGISLGSRYAMGAGMGLVHRTMDQEHYSTVPNVVDTSDNDSSGALSPPPQKKSLSYYL